ncbi:hypothetical protein OUZ56_009327 [Daphnia magna]|uniref:Uncharacterized protein n=1 Tax=Daphnia magna TaxID=35525 RepID=A0ABR0AFW9_9CRUS|nr:hypothetical protein OUZ56_009327 [Daphnia magna]
MLEAYCRNSCRFLGDHGHFKGHEKSSPGRKRGQLGERKVFTLQSLVRIMKNGWEGKPKLIAADSNYLNTAQVIGDFKCRLKEKKKWNKCRKEGPGASRAESRDLMTSRSTSRTT